MEKNFQVKDKSSRLFCHFNSILDSKFEILNSSIKRRKIFGDMGNCIDRETENFLALMGPRVDTKPLKHGEECIIFLIGGPGVGKNTLSEKLSSRYNLKLISVTNILREEVNKETDRGKFFKSYMIKGNVIPADYIVQLVVREMLKDAPTTVGYLIVGFPRDKKQVIDYIALIRRFSTLFVIQTIYIYI